MYPVYPLLCLLAAFTLDSLAKILNHLFKQAIAYLAPTPTPTTNTTTAADTEPTSTTTTEGSATDAAATATTADATTTTKPKKSKYLRYIRLFLLVNAVLLAAPLGIARVVSNFKNFNGKWLGCITCILY